MFSLETVDRVQWRALVLASIRTDLRSTGRALTMHAQPSSALAFVGSLAVFALMGTAVSILVGMAPDLYLAATAFLFVLGFAVASSLLIEYQSVVLSPADFRQLAFQPVTSRTFFAARLTSLAVYVGALTVSFSAAPVVATGIAHGGLVVAVAAAAAALAFACAVTLAVVGLYISVLKFVPASHLTQALSYLQLAFGFLVYGSYMVVPALLGEQFLKSASLPKAWWTLANPASWFAAWVTFAAGGRTTVDLAGPALSMAALLATAWFVAGRLSIDYAQRLGEIDEAAGLRAVSERGRPLRDGWLFANGEARAVALLVRAQFRYDHRFRMTVLSVVPMTLVYLAVSFNHGTLDPFSTGEGEPLLYLAVMMFPPILRTAIGQSDAYRAAWVFHGTPARKGALVSATKQLIVASFLVPYLLLLGALYITILGNPWAILLHMAVLGLISHLVLAVDVLINPDVPFSKPPNRSGMNAALIVSVVLLTFIGLMLHVGLRFAYATAAGTIALVSGLFALNVVAEIALRARLAGVEDRAEFDV